MELERAIEILTYHQDWRLGKRDDMIHEPKVLSQAMDVLLEVAKEKVKTEQEIIASTKEFAEVNHVHFDEMTEAMILNAIRTVK